jgi:hypothetical protein
MAMVPHERSLVNRLAGKKFTLLGVNLDNNKAELTRVERDNKISWRSFFDGRGGPIARDWQVRAIPSIYVIDHKGLIRFRDLQDQQLENAVDLLLKEIESGK